MLITARESLLFHGGALCLFGAGNAMLGMARLRSVFTHGSAIVRPTGDNLLQTAAELHRMAPLSEGTNAAKGMEQAHGQLQTSDSQSISVSPREPSSVLNP
jgi:hypothetical protein